MGQRFWDQRRILHKKKSKWVSVFRIKKVASDLIHEFLSKTAIWVLEKILLSQRGRVRETEGERTQVSEKSITAGRSCCEGETHRRMWKEVDTWARGLAVCFVFS